MKMEVIYPYTKFIFKHALTLAQLSYVFVYLKVSYKGEGGTER